MVLRKGGLSQVHFARTAARRRALPTRRAAPISDALMRGFADAIRMAHATFSTRCDDSDFVVFYFAELGTTWSSACWVDR
jgi:hypothetical protein